MQDSESRRPLRRPTRRKEGPGVSSKDYTNEEDNISYAEEDEDLLPVLDLPEHRLRFALIVGALAGIVMIGVHFLIPLANAATFQRAAALGTKMDYNTALSVAGSDCLSVVLDIAVCSVLGYLVGRFAVQRRLGFFAGLLGGAILYLGINAIRYLPNYPGNVSVPPFSPTFILPILAIALLYGIIGGLISLLATWITTRKHPYYTGEAI
jgi:hypothetical protein